MRNVTEIYRSNNLKAGDLQGKAWTLTIREVTERSFDDGDTIRLELGFNETTRTFTLNATNAGKLALDLGDDPTHWTGATVTLEPTTVFFKGKAVDSIRVTKAVLAKVTDMEDDELPPLQNPKPTKFAGIKASKTSAGEIPF